MEIFAEMDNFNVIVGKEGCKRCELVKDLYDEELYAYIYVDFKDLPIGMKRAVAKATREIGEEKLSLPYILAGEELMVLDFEFDSMEELKEKLENYQKINI